MFRAMIAMPIKSRRYTKENKNRVQRHSHSWASLNENLAAEER